MTNFANWLDTFVEEKGINTEQILEVNGRSGINFIPVFAVINQMKAFDTNTQEIARTRLVQIDFKNGDVLHFIKYIAVKMAI